jgi:hypothetical protein
MKVGLQHPAIVPVYNAYDAYELEVEPVWQVEQGVGVGQEGYE